MEFWEELKYRLNKLAYMPNKVRVERDKLGLNNPTISNEPPSVSPFGWIGPQGQFNHVPDYSRHWGTAATMTRNDPTYTDKNNGNQFNFSKFVNDHVHICPSHVTIPKNLTEPQVKTYSHWLDALNSGKFNDELKDKDKYQYWNYDNKDGLINPKHIQDANDKLNKMKSLLGK